MCVKGANRCALCYIVVYKLPWNWFIEYPTAHVIDVSIQWECGTNNIQVKEKVHNQRTPDRPEYNPRGVLPRAGATFCNGYTLYRAAASLQSPSRKLQRLLNCKRCVIKVSNPPSNSDLKGKTWYKWSIKKSFSAEAISHKTALNH